jgi:hypothetical protein
VGGILQKFGEQKHSPSDEGGVAPMEIDNHQAFDKVDSAHARKKQGSAALLCVQLLLDDDHRMNLNPDVDTFCEAVESIISSFIETIVLSVPKLISHVSLSLYLSLSFSCTGMLKAISLLLRSQPDFKQYTQPTISEHYEYNEIGEGLDLASIIEDDDSYATVTAKIKENLQRAFRETLDFSSIFDPYIKMYLQNQKMGTKKKKRESPNGNKRADSTFTQTLLRSVQTSRSRFSSSRIRSRCTKTRLMK